MKKILFCAAVAALATACTNEDDFVMNQGDSRAQGLVFDVTLDEGATTKGEIWKDENGKYPFKWYAEADRISVFALNAEATTTNSDGNGVATLGTAGAWTLPTSAASYKATQSAGTGLFTAADDKNMLSLEDYDEDDVTTTATIVATYGGIKAKAVKSELDDSGNAVPEKLEGLVLETVGSNAVQAVERPNEVNAPMYSVSKAVKEKAYNSFGEKANLKLIRPFPVLRFTTKNTEDYIEDFGELTSVELEALGTVKADGTIDNTKKSVLAYGTGKEYTVIGSTVGFGTGYENGTTPNKVKVTLNDGEWTDNDAVYMTVAPVEREAVEGLKVEYSFENITFTLDPSREGATDFEKALKTGNNWTAVNADGSQNAVTAMPALDIDNYNYLVTEETSAGNDRVLIVIKGSFSDIFADKTNVAWNGNKVPVAEFSKIVSKVALTDAELGTIKEFGNLKDLTLAENTSIPANTFTTTQAGQMVKLDLPKVTTVSKKFVNNSETVTAFAALETLKMPAYSFEDENINKSLLNPAPGNAKLKVLDMSGVTSMMPIYGILRTMVFTDYTALEEVTVKDGLIVAPKGFKGCKALKTVTGKLDISKASEAFAMGTVAEGENNSTLTTVEINGTVIPEGAFTDCTKLATVKYNGNIVAPTAIGSNAFAGTEIQYMDLSNAKTIGEAAFSGCTKLAATNKEAKDLVVGTEKIAKGVFENCTSLVIVKFTNATEIVGGDVFAGADKLQQVKFEKVFKLADDATGTANLYTNVFTANPGVIDFWVNAAQTGVSGSKLTLNYKKGAGSSATTEEVTYEFKSIQ